MTNNSSQETSFFKKITYKEGIYPTFDIEFNQNPNKIFAIPLIGILVKLVLVIPVAIELILLSIWVFIVAVLINPFIVLFTGKYWAHAYTTNLGAMRLTAKVTAYIYGLTDKYPGFGLDTLPGMTLDIPIIQNPSKIRAIPLIGGLIRIIFMIPYFLYVNVLAQAVVIGVFLLAWAVVLFKGRYPEGIFELARDSIRVQTASNAYMVGLSDRYPSFYISMKHDKIKIVLIVISIILSGWNYSEDYMKRSDRKMEPAPFSEYKQNYVPSSDN